MKPLALRMLERRAARLKREAAEAREKAFDAERKVAAYHRRTGYEYALLEDWERELLTTAAKPHVTELRAD